STSNGWKYTETSNISSPFEFIVDYSLLFGGTGVQMGDVIEYFIVAQDLYTPPNVGINSGDFNTPPVSVNLTSAAFPITGTINSYYIITTLNGTVTVGSGGDYATLTGANGLFETFNGNIVTGNVTAEIISDITETGEFSLTEWVESGAGNYTLTIQPNSGVVRTLSGTYSDGLFRLEGADRVTIDGRFNGSGNYLTFENTNANSNTAVFRFLSLGAGLGCSDVTLRNCNIKGGANTSSNIFGIFLGSSTGSLSTGNAGGADYDNISILENNIWNCREGLFARGTSTDQMQNFVVSRNVIGSDIVAESVTEYGMYLGYATAPEITYNEVFNMIYDVSKWGIYFTNNTDNALVSKNKIHSIKQPGTTGYNSVGIVFWSSTGCFDNQIDNNMIYDLSTYGNTSMYLVGIRIAGGSGYKVNYNSISINDAIGNPSPSMVSSCLYISTATTNLDLRNNIFTNTRTGNDPKNYAVFSPNTTTFTSVNYNDYWTTGSVLGYFGSDISTLGDWRTATGQDLNSISKEVFFVSTTDLHLTGTSNGDFDLAGIPIAGITTDIDDDIRNTTFPYMGADEAIIPLPVELTSFGAEISKRDIIINWSTVTEKNNEGFEIERKLGGDWEKIGFKEGNGTTTEQSFYSFIDNFDYESYQGKIFYRLKQMDFDGTYTYSAEIEIDADFTPKEYTLYQNYPNPFNPITKIKYSLPFESNVRIEVYNVLGEQIDVLVDELKQVGFHDLNWNASNFSSGIYIYRIDAKSVTGDQRFSSVKKMILMK
ncbi:MAG: T9SS type A sorting domain-containing protein, partial [Ignavibacteriaceae bacterium]|nr:T9SS type A sorting domain-containing protein [Ignavibacteriaceae bacterium]